MKIVRDPQTRARFAALGADAVGSSTVEFAEFVRRDMQKYATIVKISGAKVD